RGHGHAPPAVSKRARVVVALVVIAASLGWVAARGLSSSLVYYNTPTDLLRKGNAAIGDRARLGGFVVPGTVTRKGRVLRFLVTDDTTRMTVLSTGSVPELLRAGQGVVVGGLQGRAGAFPAANCRDKHD